MSDCIDLNPADSEVKTGLFSRCPWYVSVLHGLTILALLLHDELSVLFVW